MTHEELMEAIKDKFNFHTGKHDAEIVNALYKVVELHKPVQGSSDIQTYNYTGCDACVEWSHDGNMNVDYPCPTIRAIEKELG